MKSNLLFDFTVDKETNTIHIKREFDAELDLVWQAWTTPDLRDQWWGPKPCTAKTKTFDLREGGHWLYCMIVPPSITGEETDMLTWGKQEFEKVVPKEIIAGEDYFCDEDGVENTELPKGKFEDRFSSGNGKTLVTMISKYDSFEDIKMITDMGFKEGITMCLDQLEMVLQQLNKVE